MDLSNKKLNLKEKNAATFGLNHHILPKKIQKDKLKISIEKLVYSLKRNTNTDMDDETKDELKFLMKKFTEDNHRACSTRMNQSLHCTLHKLSQDSKIKVCRYDKGKAVAILNSTDYYEKLDKIVNGRSKFVELQIDSNKHPLIAKENSLAYYIRKYLKSVEGYAKLIPSGSGPGKLYGMAKVHKANVPLRSVVSMIGTPEYELSKFLDNFIKPYIPDRHLLKSTDHFVEKLKQIQFSKNQVMVSFDVLSLFTNVPLSETIELIADRIYNEDNPNAVPFNRDIFKKLMFLATQEIFMFNDRLYKQIDGVTMSYQLGPTLANFFLGHFEETIFAQNSSVAPKLYLRYTDDVYAVFDDNNSCTSLLSILNSQHKDIKFTVENNENTLILGRRN